MSFCITGVGTAVPRELITQDDAARMAIELAGTNQKQGSAVQALYRKTGVDKRHSTLVDVSTNGHPATQSFFLAAADQFDQGPSTAQRMRRYEADAITLARQAAQNALLDSDTLPSEISHLISVSCTGFSAPGVDISLVEELSLPRSVTRTNIGFMGCHGALNGLRVANAMSQATSESKTLLCCVELCSIHHQYSLNPQQIVANALFSDGAAAVVGTSTSSTSESWRIVDQRSYVLPGTSQLMTWQVGNFGFEMSLSPRVPSVIREVLRPWLENWLKEYSLSVKEVRSWAIHPGGPRILTACADALNLDYSYLKSSQNVLANYGNMSSPTVLFILEQLRKEIGSLPCIALAFGPGLTIEAALII